MNPFHYERADTVPAALALIHEAAERAEGNASARCLAGGRPGRIGQRPRDISIHAQHPCRR